VGDERPSTGFFFLPVVYSQSASFFSPFHIIVIIHIQFLTASQTIESPVIPVQAAIIPVAGPLA
jgi:hypothetical protein